MTGVQTCALPIFTPVVRGKPVALVKVAEAGVPSTGAIRVAPLFRTTLPVPVETVVPVPPLATGRVPATPVLKDRFIQFARLPEAGVPRAGVTRVGLLAKTKAPEPVSSETAEARFALDGVAKKVATPVPRPETPVEMGKPVAFVSVAAEGVPRFGVTRVGLLANTFAPVPVSSVKAAAKFALEGVAKKVATLEPSPEIPVEIGRAHV